MVIAAAGRQVSVAQAALTVVTVAWLAFFLPFVVRRLEWLYVRLGGRPTVRAGQWRPVRTDGVLRIRLDNANRALDPDRPRPYDWQNEEQPC
jgi:hypothetical protein